MATLSQVRTRLQSIDLDDAVPKIILETSFEITLLNQLQMQQGLSGEGTKISPKYKSNTYAKKKAGMNLQPGFGTPDIKLTGALYQGMGVVIVNKDNFGIQTSVEYGDKLEDYYKRNGSTIFKLTDESKGKYAKGIFFEKFRRYISDKTQLL